MTVKLDCCHFLTLKVCNILVYRVFGDVVIPSLTFDEGGTCYGQGGHYLQSVAQVVIAFPVNSSVTDPGKGKCSSASRHESISFLRRIYEM